MSVTQHFEDLSRGIPRTKTVTFAQMDSKKQKRLAELCNEKTYIKEWKRLRDFGINIPLSELKEFPTKKELYHFVNRTIKQSYA